MKVAIIGANGQLGNDVCKSFKNNGDDIFSLNHDSFDIREFGTARDTLSDIGPDFIVNTAAMHNVEECESNPEKAFAVNGIGAKNLALISNELDCCLIHISTDYVFDGNKKVPYIETDSPRPINVYGNTKLSGELFVQTIADKYFILRVSGLYGENPCRAKGGLNFVSLMLKLAKERDEVRVVNDEFISPTYTNDIARQIVHMSRSSDFGLYHVSAQEGTTWYEFAKKIFELTNTSVKLSIAEPGEFPSKVPRPNFSIMENCALKEIGIDIMPSWVDGLKKYLNDLSINMSGE